MTISYLVTLLDAWAEWGSGCGGSVRALKGPTSRGLHSSTVQLKVSAFCELRASTFRLDVSTFLGLCSETLMTNTPQVEPKSGRLMWLQ